MADTARTLAELQVLLADNTTGAISPQDVRDMLVSLTSIHGEITLNSAATTPVASVDVWYPVSGTFWDLTSSSWPPAEWDEPTDGQLRYTGIPARRVVALSTVTTDVGAGTIQVEYGIGKNGTVIPASITGSVAAAGFPVALAPKCLTEFDTNDYLTLMVRNITDATDIITQYGSLIAQGFI